MSLRAASMALVGSAIILIGACSTLDYYSEADPEADFSGYSTYMWTDRPDNTPGGALEQHLDLRLRRVIDDVLEDKGLQVARALPQADLLLIYYAGFKDRVSVRYIPYSNTHPYGYGYWGTSPWGHTDVRHYSDGSIVLDVIDHKTHKLVWSGAVSGAVRNENPPSDRVEKVARKLLADFPPK
ncbi:MAG: DUF4136 domain-containing protein [bacterium]|nr:DUF4136 domain-containing protein [bacterium]